MLSSIVWWRTLWLMVFSPLGRIQTHTSISTRFLYSFLLERRAGTYPKSILLVSPKSHLVFALLTSSSPYTHTQKKKKKGRENLDDDCEFFFKIDYSSSYSSFIVFLLPPLVLFLAYHHSCLDNIFSIQSSFLCYTSFNRVNGLLLSRRGRIEL